MCPVTTGNRKVAPIIFFLALVEVINTTIQIAPAAIETRSDIHTTFFHANQLYKSGEYQQAAKEYEDLLQAGYSTSALYFNLGNAYFKIGTIGKAILNYERAALLRPRDSDVKANLTYARSQVEGYQDYPLHPWLVNKLIQLHHIFNLSEMTIITTCLYLLLCLLLIVKLLRRKVGNPIFSLIRVNTFFLLLALTSLSFQIKTFFFEHPAVVITEEANVRFEPEQEGTVHFTLYEGNLVKITRTQDGWYQIRRKDGRGGWIEDKELEKIH